MLELIKQDLLSPGIQPEQRISINFEDRYFTDYTDAKLLSGEYATLLF